jgi:hypothetical protein
MLVFVGNAVFLPLVGGRAKIPTIWRIYTRLAAVASSIPSKVYVQPGTGKALGCTFVIPWYARNASLSI